eukprot:126048_1
MEQKIIFRPRKIRLQSNNLLAQQLANQMEELDKFIARSRLQLIARSLEKQLAKRMDEAMLKERAILEPYNKHVDTTSITVDVKISPAIQASAKALAFKMRRDSLNVMLNARPDVYELVDRGILKLNIIDSIIQSMTPNAIDDMQHILRDEEKTINDQHYDDQSKQNTTHELVGRLMHQLVKLKIVDLSTVNQILRLSPNSNAQLAFPFISGLFSFIFTKPLFSFVFDAYGLIRYNLLLIERVKN